MEPSWCPFLTFLTSVVAQCPCLPLQFCEIVSGQQQKPKRSCECQAGPQPPWVFSFPNRNTTPAIPTGRLGLLPWTSTKGSPLLVASRPPHWLRGGQSPPRTAPFKDEASFHSFLRNSGSQPVGCATPQSCTKGVRHQKG